MLDGTFRFRQYLLSVISCWRKTLNQRVFSIIGLLVIGISLIAGCIAQTGTTSAKKEGGIKLSDLPKTPIKPAAGREIATFAGGCFWCTEAVFVRVRGILDVESGYCNGHVPHPTYEQVCDGNTGHVEVIRLRWDDRVISLRNILEIFFAVHDPTTLNRQGADVGTQYRSAVFYHDDQQKKQATDLIAQLNKSGDFDSPIVTTLEPNSTFYSAEDYHQDYFANNPSNPYCMAVVGPKVSKFRKKFKDYLKKDGE